MVLADIGVVGTATSSGRHMFCYPRDKDADLYVLFMPKESETRRQQTDIISI
jgi:hypothetical protein